MIALFVIAGIFLLLSIVILITVFTIKFDEEHSASQLSWHYKLYEFITFDTLNFPKTICEYYWNFVGYLWMIPFTAPVLIIGTIFKKLRGDHLATYSYLFWGWNIISFALGVVIYSEDNFLFWKSYLTGFVVLTGIILVALATALLIYNANDMIKEKRINRIVKNQKRTSIILIQLKSWKQKNCPMINWK